MASTGTLTGASRRSPLSLEGEFEHRDTAGGFGVLGPGDAQYMVAGLYAMHYELAHGGRPVRTLQLWLNLPSELKLTGTRYVDLPAADAGSANGQGARARVYAGRVGDVPGAPAERFAKPFTLIDAELDPDAELLPNIPLAHAAIVYVVDGEVETGGRAVRAAQSARFDDSATGPATIRVRARKPSTELTSSARSRTNSAVCSSVVALMATTSVLSVSLRS